MSRLPTTYPVILSRLLPAVLLLAAIAGGAGAGEKQVIGWIERIAITTEAVTMEAKVDTGADYSSVHADDIRYFMRDNVHWVEFTLQGKNGRKHILQRPVVRMSRIKKKTKGFQERPVVMLEICVGNSRRSAQVNLAERGHFTYPLLLGRNFLSPHYLVDSGSKYLLAPNCR